MQILYKKKYKIFYIKTISFEFTKWAPTWNEESELSDGSYSGPDIQDHQKHKAVTDNLLIKIYVNQIQNRITNIEYYPELLTPGTKKLLESTKSSITKDENSENGTLLKILN